MPDSPQSTVRRFLSFLGLTLAGDLAGLTTYTSSRGKFVAFPVTTIDKPPSAKQLHQRARLALAQSNWSSETILTRDDWLLLADRLNICMTGHNLYIALSLNPDTSGLDTATRRAGLTLAHPPEIPL